MIPSIIFNSYLRKACKVGTVADPTKWRHYRVGQATVPAGKQIKQIHRDSTHGNFYVA